MRKVEKRREEGSRPQSSFRFSKPAQPGHEKKKALETEDFPVLDVRTHGLHVCSRNVSIYCMRLSMAAVEANSSL